MTKHDTRSLRTGAAILLSALLLCAALILIFPVSASASDDKPLTGLTATEVVAQMGFGWNLGNTFDATGGNAADIYSQEKSWGNPQVTKEQIDAVAEAGFKTIRIPVTWNNHIIKDGTDTLNPKFVERVEEVVGYALENDLFVILNVHHESWVNVKDLETSYPTVAKRLHNVWTQLAEHFAHYDQHLIFEGMNEPRKSGTSVEWTGNSEAYAAVNYLNQVFVNAVRNVDDGYNWERCLMIPGYAASSSANIMESVSLPTYDGEVAYNLIASVHCYSPYDFCLSDKQMDFDPTNSSHTSSIDQVFQSVKSVYLDNGIPVVIGETGVTNKDNTEARERWATYMSNTAASYGVPIVLWDNGAGGNSGGECHAHMNRREATWNYPTVLAAFLSGLDNVEWGSAMKSSGSGDSYTSLIGASTIWYEVDGKKNAAQWDASYIANPAKASYFTSGRDIAIIYTGEGEPKLILDSEAKGAWWIPVDPTSRETVGDKKIAYFSYDACMTAMKANGVDNPADLRNMSVVATNGDITTYEIAVTGSGAGMATYKANGLNLGSFDTIPADPTFPGLIFKGWYTTKNYLPGTEFDGATTEDVTVYAKFSLDPKGIEVEEEATPTPTTKPEATPTTAPAEPTEAPSEDATTGAPTQAPADDTAKDTKPFPVGIIFAIAAGAIALIGGAVAYVKRKK